MTEQNPILAPLTRDMLTRAASEQTGFQPNTATVRSCVDFALWALKEADRLALPWKKRQECELKGHRFTLSEDDMPNTGLNGTTGTFVMSSYTAKTAECANCDAVLAIGFKERI